MLKRAFSKLKLEHVVIGKGQFKQERSTTDTMEVCVSNPCKILIPLYGFVAAIVLRCFCVSTDCN